MTTAGVFILAFCVTVLVSVAIVRVARWTTNLYINWRY